MKVELFLWVFALSLAVYSVAEAKPSTKHKEKDDNDVWENWGQWFPDEEGANKKQHTQTVPKTNYNKNKADSKKHSDFSFDKSLALKDDVDSFVDQDGKKSFLKKEEKGEKDWHAEFDKSFEYSSKDDNDRKENEIESKNEENGKTEGKSTGDMFITIPAKGGENKKDNIPSGFNSFDSIIPEKVPVEETGDEKESVKEGFPVYNTKHESVKKDLAYPSYLKEFANTKPEPKTSPNPPPPGLGDVKPPMVTPAVKTMTDKSDGSMKKIHITSYIESKPSAFCKVDRDCKSGRMCHEGVCMCLPDDACLKHSHPVCGSDGLWYPSHCELHRTACIHRIHIKVDRSRKCLKHNEDTPAHVVKKTKTSHSNVDAPVDPQVPANAVIDSKEIYVGKYKEDHKKPAKKYFDAKATKESGKTYSNQFKTKCTYNDYQQFKEKLLLHHCNRFAEPDCKKEVQTSKDREYLATLIFSYYDRDIDYYLEKKDLDIMQNKEQLVILDTVCTLLDVLVYDDQEPKDGKLSVTEFLQAFDKSDHKESQEIDLQIIPTLATVGNGLELKCAILGEGNGEDVIWKRFDTEIIHSTDGLTVFGDGSLFFNQVGVHHIGNYSCSHKNTNIKQVHVLKVQMSPLVRVSPVSQLRLSNTDITVKCHTEGIPTPSVSWEINEMALPNDPQHFQQSDYNETLTIHNADYHRDTGAYKCVAKNQAGTAEDVASIFIQDDHTTSYSSSHKSHGTFMVFHTHGYTAYRPESCLMRREVRGKFGNFKFIPDNLDEPMSLCHNNKCDWGTSVNVKDEFVYISQPSQNRIVVIETTDKWNPVQVIDTDREPIGLYYIPHLDQVWVLCWNGKDDGTMKTVVVIRDASQDIQHHAVHTQPVGNRFDLVKEIFIPPQNNLNHHFNFGYIVHSEQRGLFKLDLIEMKYVNVIDFSQFDCIPKSLAFVPIGGHVVVECVIPSSEKTLQIVLDYITDAIISHISLPGRPFVSPDSRHVVTVDYFSGKVAVSTISQDGVMEMGFEVIVSTVISDIEFFPSSSRKGYDFIMSSADTEDIIILSLNNGKVQKIKGTHKIGGDVSLTPSHSTRTVVSGGIFGDFFMMPFDSTISIIDGKHHHVKCEFKGVLQSKGIVFVEN